MKTNSHPKVSFVIPTLNAQLQLDKCLSQITKQDYQKDKIEIIISDGGSDDLTLKIAKKYNCIVVKNTLKTAEAGKAVGVIKSTGEFIVLIDSDNLLPNKKWLRMMIDPLISNNDYIGSEPYKYSYRKNAGIVERYSALTGVNDPYALICGIYDRYSFITNKWTGLKIEQIDKGEYIEITLNPKMEIPTIGANGTIFRSSFLKKNINNSKYLFDIDIIYEYLNKQNKSIKFAKIKTGIIHTYCENSIKKFIRKQNRRVVDFYIYSSLRSFSWTKTNKKNSIIFALYTLLLFPSIFDSIKGYVKKPDTSWLIHPLLCLITFYIYSINTIKYKLGILKPLDRKTWQQ